MDSQSFSNVRDQWLSDLKGSSAWVSWPVFAWRVVRVVSHLLLGFVLLVVLGYWIRHDLAWQKKIVMWWHRKCCQALSLDIQVEGQPHDGPMLVVSNHISWSDIPVLGSQTYLKFLAKQEVREWPMVGWLAATTGTIFIKRGGGMARQIAEKLAAEMKSGSNVLVFPEGTSTNGESVKKFYPRLFGASIDAELPVQPVSIEYLNDNGGHIIAPFIDDDEFHTHLLNFLRVKSVVVKVCFLSPLYPQGYSKEQLADLSHQAVIYSRKENS